MISDYRGQHGQGPVTLDAALMKIATAHATRMADEDQVAHDLPGEGSFTQRLAAGNFQGARAYEALFAGPMTATLSDVLNSWEKSPVHDRNLLAPGVSRIGIFAAHGEQGSKYGTYWTLVLGELSAFPPPNDGVGGGAVGNR
nr:CAP domain-containing protein [Sphingomonas brevis]